VILEDSQLGENRLRTVKLGLEQILTLCRLAMQEIEMNHEKKTRIPLEITK